MKMFKFISLTTLIGSLLFASAAHAVPPTNVSGLVGTWYNINANDNGIIKVVVTNTSRGLRFKSYGSCSPTPCVHTTVVAYPHSASVSSNTAVGFTSYRNDGFKYSRYSAMRTGSYLRLDSFSTFASGDSRKNYAATDYFKK
jgi:hypothetical protein